MFHTKLSSESKGKCYTHASFVSTRHFAILNSTLWRLLFTNLIARLRLRENTKRYVKQSPCLTWINQQSLLMCNIKVTCIIHFHLIIIPRNMNHNYSSTTTINETKEEEILKCNIKQIMTFQTLWRVPSIYTIMELSVCYLRLDEASSVHETQLLGGR